MLEKKIQAFYKEIKEKNKLTKEEYDDIVNEVEAEIVGQGIPYNKIFNNQGNIIPKEELDKDPEWKKVLVDVVAAIKSSGLIGKFSADKNGMDITPGIKGWINLNADDGTKYKFNISTKKIVEV